MIEVSPELNDVLSNQIKINETLTRSCVLPFLDNWVDSVSFLTFGDDVEGSTDQLHELWTILISILKLMTSNSVKLLIMDQKYVLDIILQQNLIESYHKDPIVWFKAAECLVLLHSSSSNDFCLWQFSDFSPFDTVSSLFEVYDSVKTLLHWQDLNGREDLYAYSIQSIKAVVHITATMELHRLMPPQNGYFAKFTEVLADLLTMLSTCKNKLKTHLSQLVQSYLFQTARVLRPLLVLARENKPMGQRSAVEQEQTAHDEGVFSRYGAVINLLCTHPDVCRYPLICLTVVRCHASVCLIPTPAPHNGSRSFSVSGSSSSSFAAFSALQRLHQTTQNFLLVVYNNVVTHDSLTVTENWVDFRNKLVSAIAPLTCCEHSGCRNAARLLLRMLVQLPISDIKKGPFPSASSSQFPALNSPESRKRELERHLRLTSIFNDEGLVLVSLEPFLQGLLAGCTDQSHDGQLLGDDSSVVLCLFVDEAMEFALRTVTNHVNRNASHSVNASAGAKYSSAAMKAVAAVTEKILLVVSEFPSRPLLSLSLCEALRSARHCKALGGCYELLHANEDFVYIGESDRASVLQRAITPGDSHQSDRKRGIESSGNTSREVRPKVEADRRLKDMSYLDELAMDEEAEERQSELANRGRNKLINIVTKPESAAARFEESGWDIINRSGGVEQSRRLLPVTKTTSSVSSSDSNWKAQLEELKQQKAEARLKAAGAGMGSSAGSVAPHDREIVRPRDVSNGSHARKIAGRSRESSSLLQSDYSATDSHDDYLYTPKHSAASNTGAIDLKQFIPSATHRSGNPKDVHQPAAIKWTAGSLEAVKAAYSAKLASAGGDSRTIAESLAAVNIDSLFVQVLGFSLDAICRESAEDGGKPTGETEASEGAVPALQQVPIRFLHEDQYISTFRPLMLEEVKAAIGAQLTGSNGDDNSRNRGQSSSAGRAQFTALPLKCLLRNARRGTDQLEEAHVTVVRGDKKEEQRGPQLHKEDLVMVMRSKIPPEATKLRDLVRLQYSLAVVMTAAKRPSEESGSKISQQTLLVLGGASLPRESVWQCVPVMSLSTFMREWIALQSISSHKLMPLAPYILKGSPVVSSSYLSSINESLAKRVQTLQCVSPTEDRLARLNDAILLDLSSLIPLQVDGSVLKNTGIAKLLQKINNKAVAGLFSEPCVSLAASLLGRWKEQVKTDHKSSTIQNMKGGKLVKMPEGAEALARPRCIPPQLWTKLCASYNSSQLFAIKYVSDQFEGGQDTRIALIQGPPGTGKTSTILGMVSALLHRTAVGAADNANSSDAISNDYTASLGLSFLSARQRLLICAPSNAAVDELLTRLSNSGVYDSRGESRKVKIVRLGEPLEDASETIRSLTLENQIEALLERDPLFAKLQLTVQTMRELDAKIRATEGKPASTPKDTAQYHAVDWKPPSADKNAKVESTDSKLKKLRSELATQRQVKIWAEIGLERIRGTLRHTIMLEADIVAGTLSGSGRQQFLDHIVREDVVFDTAIVDEAAQTTEPSTLIPLKFGCRRLVLVGDPRQLPATVLSRKADRAGLGLSLFERLERANHEVVMLTIQYRMHPEIRQFPSQCFYEGMLVDSDQIVAEMAAQKNAVDGVACSTVVTSPELTARGFQPVAFFDVYSSGEVRSGRSFRNEAEARYVLSLLERLHSASASSDGDAATLKLTVAIITPYKAQVRLIRELCRSSVAMQAVQARRRAVGTEIEVNSVDGFQGREKDVVIFSCVRSSSSSHQHHGSSHSRNIGFVSDERRMNVAVTRAKKALLIVGDKRTLQQDKLWNSLLQSLKERGFINNT